MMIACNIPLAKVEQPEFINFFEKHCGKRLPSRTTLTKCMEEECETICSKIKEQLKEKDILTGHDRNHGWNFEWSHPGTSVLIGLSDVTTINNTGQQILVNLP
ncbi:Putative LOC100571931, partial [Caligus rogercresseyi]